MAMYLVQSYGAVHLLEAVSPHIQVLKQLLAA
jgi:hypothetical protein